MIDPNGLKYDKAYFSTYADYLCYWRAWTIYDEHSDDLNDWESGFIDSITSAPRRSFSDKQRACVNKIYEQKELL